jgi:glycosyltransferase involved in cell wall biosynthesis
VGSGFQQRDSAEAEILSSLRKRSDIRIFPPTSRTVPFYQASDINVLISEREGMPNAILEGMSCGLPTLGTSIPGITDLVTPNQEGLLVRPTDVSAIVGAIERLVGDKALREKLGMAARRKVVENFDIRIVAAKYLERFCVLKGRR